MVFPSRNLALLGLEKGNEHAMSRRAHNLGLVELGMPVPAILEPLILLQQPDDCRHTHKQVSRADKHFSPSQLGETYA